MEVQTAFIFRKNRDRPVFVKPRPEVTLYHNKRPTAFCAITKRVPLGWALRGIVGSNVIIYELKVAVFSAVWAIYHDILLHIDSCWT